MEYANIKLTKEQGIATIRLNRPDAMNALGRELVADLSSVLAEVAADDSVKAMVLRGEGRCFCAGADLKYFQDAFQSAEALRDYLTEINDVIFQVEDLPVPVIAVVHGFALAGGLELMMACDMALVADDARIGDQHVNFGLMPGGGSHHPAAPTRRPTAGDGAADHGTLAQRPPSRGVGPGPALGPAGGTG